MIYEFLSLLLLIKTRLFLQRDTQCISRETTTFFLSDKYHKSHVRDLPYILMAQYIAFMVFNFNATKFALT